MIVNGEVENAEVMLLARGHCDEISHFQAWYCENDIRAVARMYSAVMSEYPSTRHLLLVAHTDDICR